MSDKEIDSLDFQQDESYIENSDDAAFVVDDSSDEGSMDEQDFAAIDLANVLQNRLRRLRPPPLRLVPDFTDNPRYEETRRVFTLLPGCAYIETDDEDDGECSSVHSSLATSPVSTLSLDSLNEDIPSSPPVLVRTMGGFLRNLWGESE